MSPSSVPPQVPSSGRPLPFRRVPWGRFPDLTGTISRLLFLASPRASLRFLRSALPPLRPSSLPRGGTTPRGPGLLLPRRPRRLSSVEKTRPPRFLDNPCVHAPLSDPGGPPAPGHYRTGDGVFRTADYVDSTMMLISGLNHAACTLPVYASRPRSPQDAQHSVPAGGQPCRAGLSPAGSHRRFLSCLSLYMASSFTKLCLAHNRGKSTNHLSRLVVTSRVSGLRPAYHRSHIV